ncbi:MAG: response regulator [Deltaproteobacteria bacterium]|nr:response regulator [Deltaproteobacteria bacterium]
MTPSGRHILLVEDNLADAKLAMKILNQSAEIERVHHVTDGDQAMNFLNRVDAFVEAPIPDLIILDLNLPRRGGREILKEIKENPRFQQIPVVILTSSDSESDVMACLRLHANAYVTKALDLFQFVEVLHSLEKFWLVSAKLPMKSSQ